MPFATVLVSRIGRPTGYRELRTDLPWGELMWPACCLRELS